MQYNTSPLRHNVSAVTRWSILLAACAGVAIAQPMPPADGPMDEPVQVAPGDAGAGFEPGQAAPIEPAEAADPGAMNPGEGAPPMPGQAAAPPEPVPAEGEEIEPAEPGSAPPPAVRPPQPRSRTYPQVPSPAATGAGGDAGADAGANGAPPRNGNGGGQVTRENGGMMLNFRDASIDVVLDELSAAAGYVVVKEVKPTGRVTLTSRQPVNADEAVTLLNTVLHNAGYSAIKQGRILKIVARDQAKRMNIPVHSGADPEQIAPTDEMITQVIPLRYANAKQLKDDLQPLVNPQADFASNESSNALVITDTSANVRRVVEIIAALDTSLADAVKIKVFPLQYASAVDAAKLINDIFGSLTVGGTSSSGQQGGRGGMGGGFAQRIREDAQREARAAALGNKITASADTRTNSVVVSGSENAIESVAEVLKELDANPVADENVFVFRLRNAQALNVESVVNNLFGNPTVSRSGSSNLQQNTLNNARSSRGTSTRGGTSSRSSRGSSMGGGGTFGQTGAWGGGQTGRTGGWGQQGGFSGAQARLSPAAQQQAGALAGQVTIIADPDTNSLLVRTSPVNYEKVKGILAELDKPVAQVLIKVLIAEVTHDNASDLGTELSVLNLRANGNGQSAGTNFNIPTQGVNATGLVVQILETNFTAAIRALETQGKLDVLSRPYILASDNQLASITVGQEVPFITNSRITDEGGIINTIEYGDIGILLDVIPHINPDGLVILDVAPEISALTGGSVPLNEQVSSPIIAKRSAQSRVGVRNGQTIVIGGLMEDRKTQTLDKVPLLGDIPLVGLLFQRNRITKAKTELLIFLTPHVASDPDQLGAMSEEEQQGVQIVPDAVEPGTFQRHIEGMQQGRTAPPATMPGAVDEDNAR